MSPVATTVSSAMYDSRPRLLSVLSASKKENKMSVSILEALRNADYNLKNLMHGLFHSLAVSQLHNAVELLSKGYGIHDQVEPLLEKYGTVEKVPRKGE